MSAHSKTDLAGVAVIVVTRDRPRLLADALSSVAAQTTPPVEIAVANDGEQPITDATVAAGTIPVRVIPVEVRNPGAARNRAVRATSAPVLAFLDDDDVWKPDHLAGLTRAFEDKDVAIAYRDCEVIRERVASDGTRIERERLTIARDWDPPVMRENDYIPPSAMAWRRAAFDAIGGFDESFTRSEDWDLLLRGARMTRPRRVPGVTAEIRLREGGNASADAGVERRACLDRLAARHDLPSLTIRTFWEVAIELRRLDAARQR